MGKFVLWLWEQEAADSERVGGKASRLARMVQSGLRVPPGFVVTVDAYREFVATALSGEKTLLARAEAGDAVAAAEVRKVLAEAPLPREIRRAVDEAYGELCDRCSMRDVPVAVRSSGRDEDTHVASFAGEYDSFLWIRGSQTLTHCIQRCWASLFSERAVVYRREKGASSVSMGVVVQKMVRARCAGVLFTLNPVDGDRSKMVIEASWGLGSAVVGGEVTPDQYMVDKVSMTISARHVRVKTIQDVVTPLGEVCRVPVAAELQSAPCLSDAEVLELGRLGKHIERVYGCPQDVEWAIDEQGAFPDNVFVLQCRPETVWSQRGPVYDPKANVLDWIVAALRKGK